MKRASALKRSTPLRRKRWPRRRPPRRLRKGDPVYLAFVRSLSCAAAGMGPCSGPMEAHHAGRRGVGQKSSDRETCGLCRGHHRHLTDHTGPFKGWTREQRRLWQDAAILATRAMLVILGRLGEEEALPAVSAALAARGKL